VVIRGGYYIKARCIQESDIMDMPPHTREIWDWLLMKATHTDLKHLKRGQLVCTYDDIREALSWRVGWRKMMYSKWDCEKAMKLLRKATMIATKKTTRGMIINIVQYDKYQNPENYESHRKATGRPTGKPQTTATIDKNGKNKEIRIIREGTPTQFNKDFFTNNEKQNQLLEYLEEKGIDSELAQSELGKFISYWTEPNKSGTRERWEMQQTFDVKRRLGTWFNNIKGSNNKSRMGEVL